MENINELDLKIKQMAERIRELREIVGYTTEEMAQKTGVSEEEYALCEKGEMDLNFAFIYRCASALKVNVTDIIEAVIVLISALITTFLLPYIKQKLSDEKRQKLIFWIETAVKAAEQLYGSKTGQQKKEYVVAFLLSKGIVADIDEVTALIESEVYKLTNTTEKGEI